MCNKKNRVIMIGLDGGTFKVINPLIEEGHLPTFRFLKENGTHSILLSTIPSITGPAWLALATGKNPGKTGIIDFRNLKKEGDIKLYPISSEDFIRNGALWDYVSNIGGKVCIYNYPMLYPPYKINGIMISGLGAPEDLEKILYPNKFVNELKNILKDNYQIVIPYNSRKYTNNKEEFLRDLNNLLNQNIKIIKFLLKKEKWDLFIGVISVTDFLQHYMWDIWETYQSGEKKIKFINEFIKIWKKVDDLIKFIIETNKDANLFVVSDHGFGNLRYSFNINKWLETKGYLVTKNRSVDSFKFQFINHLKSLSCKLPFITNIIRNYLRNVFRESLSNNISEIIDFQKSKAFALDHAACGHIYINHIGRNPQAPIKTKEELLKLKEQIIKELRNFVKNSNVLHEIEFFDPESLYNGDKVNLLPNIFFNIDKMACEISPTNFEYILKKYDNPNKTGDHRREGIFLAYGPLIKKGISFKEINLIDILPNILYGMGISIPYDVDGKILTKIFNENLSIKFKNISTNIKVENENNENTDEERIKKQLKDLGYL